MAYAEQAAQYYEDGYFIADDAFDPGMLAPLAAAARRAVAKVQSGEVVAKTEGISTGGPGDNTRDILGLIAPEFGEPLFAEYLGCQAIERYMHALLGPDLRLGWVAIFAIPGPEAYDTGWHRDFSHEERDGSKTVEMEILGRHRKGVVKWHMAQHRDSDSPQQVAERFVWRMADNICDGLPEKTRLYYDRWRSLQQD